MNFVQLHNHTEFSALDGMGSCKQYAERARKLGFEYLGITDHGTIDGLIKFQKECKEHDIKPILGSELYTVPELNKENRASGHMCVWTKNQTGFENLTKILSYSNEKGFYYRPRVDFEYFLNNCKGLVVSTACLGSFANVFKEKGIQFLGDLYDTVGKDLYAEVAPHNMQKQKTWNRKIIRLAKRYGLKIIATNDCHYVRRGDHKSQDVLLAIQRKTTMDNKNRFKFNITGLYLKTDKEMQRTFEKNGHPFKKEYLTNTIEICEKCSDYRIPKREISLPRVPGVPINPNKAKHFLWDLCVDNFHEKFQRNISQNREYHLRLKREYNLIIKKRFERYFFIVWELINWCKKNDILTGVGRGSVGGSLMAYLLGITSVDPIKHNLIFDRFINEDRIDYPDIDIDFEDRKRHLVRQHLESIYGKDKIAGVSSFNRMKAKAVVKDVGRAFGVHWSETDKFTKLIEEDKEDDDIIGTAIETYEDCREYTDKYPRVIKFAKKLEGQFRNYGVHAAALIISKEPIGTSGRCNLRFQDDFPIINWEKDDAEYVGLMKLDSLGLKLLSILSETLSLVEKNFNRKINLEKLPLNDGAVFKNISDGKTVGIFQFGTYAMTALSKEMGIENFDHMVSAIALVRPGPANSGVTSEYIERKHGKRWKPLHEIYERITKDTYGLIVYQEQVMQVISDVAGLPYSLADKIRKIIGKKRDVQEFEQYKKTFINGCKKTGYFNRKEALSFWDLLEKHASYSFNRCLTGDTRIIRSASNHKIKSQEISLNELYNIWNSKTPTGQKYRNPKRGLSILCLHKDDRIRHGKIKNIFFNGKRIVYKIKTKSGKEIKATKEHKFLTDNGYKKVRDLKTGNNLITIGKKEKNIKSAKHLYKYNKNKKYNGVGFQKGKENPSYIDGRTSYFKNAKEQVFKRSNGKCEKCKREIYKYCKECNHLIKTDKFEYAHIKTIDILDFNYEKYHSKKNMLLLCNSCHKKFDYKKQERKPRFSIGYPINQDEIVSIKYAGIEDTYDLEMDTEEHNFIANGIVSHNSHSVEYSILGYYCGWLKHHYPVEFICASLTYGAEKKKKEIIEEAYKLGLQIMLPKVGRSDAIQWKAIEGRLFIPFVEVKGIGDKKAIEAASGVSGGSIKGKKTRKFFNRKSNDTISQTKIGGKFGELLNLIGAYDEKNPTITKEIKDLFKFRIVANPKNEYKNLYALFGNKLERNEIDKALNANQKLLRELEKSNILTRSKVSKLNWSKSIRRVSSCDGCELFEQCTAPVRPSPGIFNVLIVGEVPNRDEDTDRIGFVGHVGNLLWKKMEPFPRRNFFISHINKCFPSKTRKPTKDQIEICTKLHLEKEIKIYKPIIILAFGNTGLQFFKNQDSGISNMSGEVAWNEKYKAWVVYCINPAATLHNPENKTYFDAGIKRFKGLIKALGMKKSTRY